jgi:ElaB/YqjD/DUF883 family membrane-anchored ribosome-binding protein
MNTRNSAMDDDDEDGIAAAAQAAKDAAAEEFRDLLSDVEDLVAKVAGLDDPEMAKIREKVQDTLSTARDALKSSTGGVRRRVRDTAHSANTFVRESPWQALAIGALVGAAVGYIAGRRS